MRISPFGTESGVWWHLTGLVLALLVLVGQAAAEVRVEAHWRLGEEENAGKLPEKLQSTVGEAVVAPNQSVAVGAACPDARGSKSGLTFDGKSSMLSGSGATGAADNFGVEAFVRAETDEGFRVVVQQGSGAHGWALVRNGKGYQVLLGGVQLLGWSGDIPKGTWAHVAFVRVGGVGKFFVNGKEAGQTNANLNFAGKDAKLAIGANTDGKSDFFEGTIDEVRIFRLGPNGFDPADLLLNQADVSAKVVPAAPATQPGGTPRASVDFSAAPVESGLTFNRSSLIPTSVAGREGWLAQQNSAPEVPWARSVLLTVTDEKFRNGNMPVVDVEVDFRQTFNSPVELRADTERGSVNLGGSWGNSPDWKTFRISLDDAVFGATQHGNKPSDMHTDGYDLRINSFGGDFAVGAVRLIGYDLDRDPDYRRLLRLESVDSPNGAFALEPGRSHSMTLTLRNLARKTFQGTYDIEFADRAGNVLSRETKPLSVDGRKRIQLPASIDATKLAKGIYDLKLTVRQTDKSDAPVVLSYEAYIAVTDTAPLPKAKPGEFLYGLDIKLGPAYGDDGLLGWADLMGADIIRHGFGWEDDINEIVAHLPKYDQHGLSVMLMCDPPKETDAAARASRLPRKLAFLEDVARRFPQIRFFELGNEPDLRFFYPGEIKDYVADYEEMARAVKRGNPSAFVMNGGLSFAGAEATARSEELVKLTDPNTIDGWAYHGHGVGIEAERSAWTRMQAVADRYGKGDKPLVETESGMAARTRSQEDVQARTVVQKMVFAQSKKMPLFMWFRLLMYEEDYGTIRNPKEPRPAVLAYRSMVKSLRGLAFDRLVDGVPSGVEAFAFRDAGSRRALVAWSNSPQTRTLIFRLEGIEQSAIVRDLNGNDRELPVKDGVVSIAVGQDPVFVLAGTQQADGQFAAVPALLEARADPVLIRGATGEPLFVSAVVSNPFKSEMIASLVVKTPSESALQVVEPTIAVKLAPQSKGEFKIPLRVAADRAGVRWPASWRVYPGASLPAKLDSMKSVPDSLPGTAGPVTGVRVVPNNYRIDFERAGGTIRERNPGLAIAAVESDVDQTVRVGASADWWMAWFVNGVQVYSTLDAGNGAGYAITDHQFDMPLKKGTNIVVVQVLSGSQGWKLLVGDPASLKRVQGTLEDRLDVSLHSASGDVLDQVAVEPTLRSPLVAPPASGADVVKSWSALDADVVLGEASIRNDFAKQPDASKWWKGESDLSARVWMRGDASTLYVTIAVRDQTPTTGAQGDRVALKVGQQPEVTLTSTDSKRVGDETWYFAKVARVGTSSTDSLSIRVDDVDEVGVVKQSASVVDELFGWPAAKP